MRGTILQYQVCAVLVFALTRQASKVCDESTALAYLRTGLRRKQQSGYGEKKLHLTSDAFVKGLFVKGGELSLIVLFVVDS